MAWWLRLRACAVQAEIEAVIAYTDGACSGNPGPGADSESARLQAGRAGGKP